MKTCRIICLLCMVIAPDMVCSTSQAQKKLIRKVIGPTGNIQAAYKHMQAFIEDVEQDTSCADESTRRRTSSMPCSKFLSGYSTNWCALAPNSRRRSFGGQARDTCKQTCNLCGEVNLKFGGASHGAAKQAKWFYRPEAIKSLVCGSTTCNECTDKDTCWHGVTSPVGYLRLSVPPSMYNIPHTRFVVELWAKCSNGKGSWRVYAHDLVNGDVTVFANKQWIGSISQSQSAKGQAWGGKKVLVNVGADTHIRSEFERHSVSVASSGQLWVMATDVDQYVDDCMAVKDCLSELGDGSKNAFNLRNDNKKQLQCLSATTDAARNAINSKCKPWVTCLAKDAGRIDKLKSLLAAGQQGSSMLLAISDRDAMALKSGDSSECIDPATDDPESWECDCVQMLIDQCGGIHADCFRTRMCQSHEICQSWKDSHCSGSLISRSNKSTTQDTEAASLVLKKRIESHGQAAIENGLDGSLEGKCAS